MLRLLCFTLGLSLAAASAQLAYKDDHRPLVNLTCPSFPPSTVTCPPCSCKPTSCPRPPRCPRAPPCICKGGGGGGKHRDDDDDDEHCPEDDGQAWLNQYGDASGQNYNPKSTITKKNLADLSLVWEQDNNIDGDGAWSWGGVTTDGKTIYACVSQQAPQPNGAVVGSYVVARDRATGEIRWARNFLNYLPSASAQGNNCRSAPAISGDFIFVAEEQEGKGFGATLNAQTFRRFGEPVDPDKVAYPIFGGPVKARGRSIQIIKINRHTGDLVWSRDIGAKANYIDDPDNLLRTSGSPIAFELDAYNTGEKIPVVALGTSSAQSSFFLQYADAPGAFFPTGSSVYNPIDFDGDGPAPPVGPFGRPAETLGVDIQRYTPTDIGRVILYDARDGREIESVYCAPKPYREGDRLEQRSLFRGKDTFQIRHWVVEADLAEGGGLNPVNAQFAGRQTLVYRLDTKAAVGITGVRNKIPAPLDGIEIQIKPPGPAAAGFGATGPIVTLIGGADITDQMDGLVVEIETEFTEGSTEFEVNGVTYDLTDPAVDLIDENGVFSTRAVMIRRRLRAGDVLDRNAAHEATAWGSTVWGNGNPTITYDEHGDPREMVFGCGQMQKAPYEYTDFAYGIGPTERAERNAAGYVEYVQLSKQQADAAAAYIADKTPENLQAYFDVLSSDLEQRKAEVQRVLDFGSDDLKRNGFDGIVVASLRPGHVGEIQSISQTRMFDSWTAVNLFGYAGLGAGFGLADAMTSYTDLQIALGTPYSQDADMGENPKIQTGAADDGTDLITISGKGGDMITYRLEEPQGCKKGGARHAVEVHRMIAGHAATLGGSNFGSCADNKYHYSAQKNDDDSAGSLNFFWQTGERGSRVPMSRELFSFPAGWVPVSSDEPLPDVIPLGTSYVTRYDPRKNTIDYEIPQPGGSSSRSCTVNKELLFASAGSQLGVHDKSTGEVLAVIDNNAGFSLIGQHALLDNDLIILPRNTPTGNNPGTMFLYSTDGTGAPPAKHYSAQQQKRSVPLSADASVHEKLAQLEQMFSQ